MLWLILLLILIAVLNVVLFFGTIWFNRADIGSESWRDKPPPWFSLFLPFINAFTFIKPKSDKPSFMTAAIERKLQNAGYSYSIKPEEFMASRWVGLAFGVGFVLVLIYGLNIENGNYILLSMLAIPIGFFYPDIWLNDAVKYRHKQISRHFPFFLELLVLSMRAGLNFSSAIEHATQKIPPGALKGELHHLVRDFRTGLSRKEALSNMARRVSMPEVSNFVAAINQAEEVGGELGNLLYKQAMQRRKERFLRAEELASKAPVKMLGPLIGLLFPMTFIVIAFVLYIKARDGGILGVIGG